MIKNIRLSAILVFFISCSNVFAQPEKSLFGVYKSDAGDIISLSTADLGPAGIQENRKRIAYVNFSNNDARTLVRQQGKLLEFGNKWIYPDSTEFKIEVLDPERLTYSKGGKIIEYTRQNLYVEQNISFSNEGTKFYGTLSVPTNTKQKPPCVILFQGAAPGDRDYLYFHSLAQYLNMRGIAVFRFDKRGSGETGGETAYKSFFVQSKDIVAAVKALKSVRTINKNKIGVVGFSEGSWLGPLAAIEDSGVKFVAAVSKGMETPEEQLLYEKGNLLRQAGYTNRNDIRMAKNYYQSIWNYYRTGKEYEYTLKVIDSVKSQPWYSLIKENYPEPLPGPESLSQTKQTPELWWLKNDALYNPITTIKKLKVPILALYGVKDRVVDSFLGELLLRHYFQHPTITTVKSFANGNHQLFESKTGFSNENHTVKKLCSGYYATLADWIIKVNTK